VGYTYFGRAAGVVWGWQWYVFAAVCLIPFILLLLRHIRRIRQVVYLHPHGLRFTEVSADHERLYWQQISGIAVHATRYQLLRRAVAERMRVTLYSAHGTATTLDSHLRDLPELAQHIRDHVYPLLLPQLKERLKNGQWLAFGAVRLNQKTLATPKQQIPWSRVKSMEVAAGRVMIEFDRRDRLRLPASKIHNLELMMQIIAEDVLP
jgi:hypothetical protein